MSPDDLNGITDKEKQVEYLVANLLDFFRNPSAEQKYAHAAKIATGQVALRLGATHNFERRFLFFSGKLKNNLTPHSLRRFAEECLETAVSLKATKEYQSKDCLSLRTLRKRAQQDLSFSLAAGFSRKFSFTSGSQRTFENKA